MASDERIYVRVTRQAIEKLGGELEMTANEVIFHVPSKRLDPLFAEYLRDELDFSSSEVEDVYEQITDISIKKFVGKAMKLSR